MDMRLHDGPGRNRSLRKSKCATGMKKHHGYATPDECSGGQNRTGRGQIRLGSVHKATLAQAILPGMQPQAQSEQREAEN